MKIKKDSTLLMIGDSITGCGRTREFEKPHFMTETEYGFGYVMLVNAMLANRYPQSRIKVLNRGVGGNTVRELDARWQKDVIEEQPQWLSICIGINDVWRTFRGADGPNTPVLLDEYQATYDRLISQTRESLRGLILISPFVLILDRNDPFRKMMDDYGKAVQNLAAKHGAIFVDAQKALDTLCCSFDPLEIAGDRIHINIAGHMAMAEAILKAIA